MAKSLRGLGRVAWRDLFALQVCRPPRRMRGILSRRLFEARTRPRVHLSTLRSPSRDVPDGQRFGPAIPRKAALRDFPAAIRAIRKGGGNQSRGLRADIGGR